MFRSQVMKMGLTNVRCRNFASFRRKEGHMRTRRSSVSSLAFCCALLAALVLKSESYVFSAMNFGLLVLCGDAARTRRKQA